MVNKRTATDLRDKLVVVTGAAGILGSGFVQALVESGARVVAIDRDAQRLQALTDGGGDGAGNRVSGHAIDITDRRQLQELRDSVRAELGEVDVLVNNAAAKSENFFEPFETFPLEDWRQVMDVNVTAAMSCCQVFGSDMAARGSGSIVNMLSVYGVVAPDQRIYDGSEYEGVQINTPAVYSTSKSALLGLTRYLAAYWGTCGVRVNAITPGGVYSGQNRTFVDNYAARVPLGRMAERGEMCGALLYLCSDMSSYVTGHNLVVDGGLTVW